MPRLTLTVTDQDLAALYVAAQRECRDPRGQAVLMLRKDLRRRGLLATKAVKASTSPADVQPAESQPT